MKRLVLLLMPMLLLTACQMTATATETSDSSLPGGIQVVVPWAQPDRPYTPTEPTGEELSYYYDAPLKEFVPSENYGTVYLYWGKFDSSNYWEKSFYGLCAQDGRIITEPIYSVLGVFGTDPYMYVLFDSSRPQIPIGDIDIYGSQSYTHPCVLVSQDGSFAQAFDDIRQQQEYGMFDPVDVGVVAVCKDGLWGGIDYAGNMVIPLSKRTPEEVYDPILQPIRAFLANRPTGFDDAFYPLCQNRMAYYGDSAAGMYDLSGNLLLESQDLYPMRTWNNRVIARDYEGGILSVYDEDGVRKGQMQGGIGPYTGDLPYLEFLGSGGSNYSISFYDPELQTTRHVITDQNLNIIFDYERDAIPQMPSPFLENGLLYALENGILYTARLDGTILTAVARQPFP